MDGFRWNDMKYSSSSDGTADHELFADIPLWDEILDDPNWHPQQEPPVYSTFYYHRLINQQFLQQGKQHENFLKSMQPSYFMPPRQLPAAMQRQTSPENQIVVRHPAEPHPVRKNENDAIKAFVVFFRNRRMELGFSQRSISRRLNRLCRIHKMDEIFSEACIFLLETQNMILEDLLKLKPILEKWLRLSSTEERRARKCISSTSLEVLVESFLQNSHPSYLEIVNLSKSLNMHRKTVSTWFYNRRRSLGKKKQTSQTANCYMPPDTSRAISPDARLFTAPVPRPDTTYAKSSLNTSDSVFRSWEPKAAATDLQVLGKGVQQNL